MSFKKPIKGFNSAGRGYPDLSALGHNFVVGLAGNFTAVSGTSASSPLMAGIIAVCMYVCMYEELFLSIITNRTYLLLL